MAWATIYVGTTAVFLGVFMTHITSSTPTIFSAFSKQRDFGFGMILVDSACNPVQVQKAQELMNNAGCIAIRQV